MSWALIVKGLKEVKGNANVSSISICEIQSTLRTFVLPCAALLTLNTYFFCASTVCRCIFPSGLWCIMVFITWLVTIGCTLLFTVHCGILWVHYEDALPNSEFCVCRVKYDVNAVRISRVLYFSCELLPDFSLRLPLRARLQWTSREPDLVNAVKAAEVKSCFPFSSPLWEPNNNNWWTRRGR